MLPIQGDYQTQPVLSIQVFMIRLNLREALQEHRRKTGERLTYHALAERTGLSVDTLQSLAARPSYNTRLSTVEKICRVLNCLPGDLLELVNATRGIGEDRQARR
jgi:DNA-binding Xre family transcriptional regulator